MTARHLRGLTAGTDVATAAFNRAMLTLRGAARDNDIAALLGPPGTGKTFCALAFLEEMAATGRRDIYLQSDVTAAHTQMTIRLLQKLQGGRPAGEGYFLADDLAALLAEHRPVVVVDEAHRASRRGLDQLIYLKETSPEWTLILVGSDLPAAAARVPGARSRLKGRTAAFANLAGAELLATLHTWHPLLEHADDQLLQRIDERYCHGNFRDWAHLLRAAESANQRLRELGKPVHAKLTAKLVAHAVAIAGLDAWEVPA